MRGVKIYHLYVMFQLGGEVESAEVRRQSSMVPFNLINSNDFAHPWSRNEVLMCFWRSGRNNDLRWGWTWFKIASQLQLFKILKNPSDRSFPPKKACCLRWISKPNPQKTLWSSRRGRYLHSQGNCGKLASTKSCPDAMVLTSLVCKSAICQLFRTSTWRGTRDSGRICARVENFCGRRVILRGTTRLLVVSRKVQHSSLVGIDSATLRLLAENWVGIEMNDFAVMMLLSRFPSKQWKETLESLVVEIVVGRMHFWENQCLNS